MAQLPGRELVVADHDVHVGLGAGRGETLHLASPMNVAGSGASAPAPW
jgi:hypothetical protein